MQRAKLWLIRHAKSDWTTAAPTDFERPLNARGQRDGPRMADWLSRQSDHAIWIWTSDATRARSTAVFVAGAFPGAAMADEHRLYNAGPEQLLDVIRETPPEVTAAAVVAHNPGMTHLVNLLTGSAATGDLPTFGVARLDVPLPWTDLAFGRATLDLLAAPKHLPEPEA